MPSYIEIEIDRKPPIVNIHAPKYTTSKTVNKIIIECNEPLSSFQDI